MPAQTMCRHYLKVGADSKEMVFCRDARFIFDDPLRDLRLYVWQQKHVIARIRQLARTKHFVFLFPLFLFCPVKVFIRASR